MVYTDKERDLPFIYVSQPGTQIQNINLQTNADGGDFLLRKIAFGNTQGADNTGVTNFQVYNRSAVSITGQLGGLQTGLAGVAPYEWIVAPEVLYKGGDTIRFDKTPASIPYVFFYGVRRFENPINPRPGRTGPWMERPYQYRGSATLEISDPATPAFSLQTLINIDIRNYDFELRRIIIVNNADGYQGAGAFAYTLFNAYGRAMMNAPILDWALDWGAQNVTNVFPTPGIVYPVGSQLRMLATNSTAGSELPYTSDQIVIFDGVQRFPCGGGL